jgi:HEPN domain-containing protein
VSRVRPPRLSPKACRPALGPLSRIRAISDASVAGQVCETARSWNLVRAAQTCGHPLEEKGNGKRETMRLDEEDYMRAAKARVHAATALYRDNRYAEAIYMAGVAVEALLRAYHKHQRRDASFDARHDLAQWWKECRISDLLPAKHVRRGAYWMSEVWSRWKNDYRFADEDRLERRYKKLKLHRGVKGDPLEHNARIVVDSALDLVTLGARRWEMRK